MRVTSRARSLISIGFLALTGAIVIAHQHPATGFELSIYEGTPALFWALSASSLIISIAVVFSNVDARTRFLGGTLGLLSMTSIVALPVIRGYHWVGRSDSLSHLGTTKDMNAGLFPLVESRYPMVHTLGSILHDATGLELPHTLLILVVIFVLSFFIFVPLTVRELTDDVVPAYIGLFSGLLLLPINHLSPSLYIHPTSQAIMFAPVMLFVFFLMYRLRIARHSLLFLLLSPMYVMLHPQQAANLILFFGTIAIIMIAYDLISGFGFRRRTEWILPEVTFFGTVFVLWVWNLDTFWSSLENVYMIPFEDTQPAETAVDRGLSLEQVGGTMPEVFVKLFLVSTIYAILTGIFVLAVVLFAARLRTSESHSAFVPDGGRDRVLALYISAGLIPLLVIFALFVFGGISDQYFRHLGMLMVLGTMLGSIVLARATRRIARRYSGRSARRSIVFVLILFVALSMPVVFASPYIYYTTDHVPEMQMSGFETSFNYQDDSIVFDDVRSSTRRYGNAILGREIPEEAYYREDAPPGVPDHFSNQSIHTHYNESIYIPVAESDRQADAELWQGFRFSHDDFEYMNSEPGVNRVQSNNGYALYLVVIEEDEGTNEVETEADPIGSS